LAGGVAAGFAFSMGAAGAAAAFSPRAIANISATLGRPPAGGFFAGGAAAGGTLAVSAADVSGSAGVGAAALASAAGASDFASAFRAAARISATVILLLSAIVERFPCKAS
jgi:hypothetical protein